MTVADPYGSRFYRRNRRICLVRDDYRCFVSGCHRLATTADHIVPVSRGGAHDLDNLRACCAHHNSVGGAQITNAKRRQKRLGRLSRIW